MKQILPLFAVLCAATTSAHADTIVFPDLIVNSVGHTYLTGSPGESYSGVYTSYLIGSSNSPSFTGEAINNGDTLQFTIKAAPGKQFQLTPGYDRLFAFASWGFGGYSPLTGGTVTFNNVSGGTPPTMDVYPQLFTNYAGFHIEQDSPPSGVITFDSLTIEILSDRTINLGTSGMVNKLSIVTKTDSEDYTQYLDLIDAGPAVPEPSTIALLLTGCIGLVGYRLRRRKLAL